MRWAAPDWSEDDLKRKFRDLVGLGACRRPSLLLEPGILKACGGSLHKDDAKEAKRSIADDFDKIVGVRTAGLK